MSQSCVNQHQETETETEQKNADLIKRYFLSALAITFLVLTAAGVYFAYSVLLPQISSCWISWTMSPSWPQNALASSQPSACLTPNEVGDFLAGIFATLAFIWLLFTVVLQAFELSAQRRELKLSRNVAEASRRAIRAQAIEANRSADYFKDQTQIMKQELDRQIQASAKAQFQDLLGLLLIISDEVAEKLDPEIARVVPRTDRLVVIRHNVKIVIRVLEPSLQTAFRLKTLREAPESHVQAIMSLLDICRALQRLQDELGLSDTAVFRDAKLDDLYHIIFKLNEIRRKDNTEELNKLLL